MSDREVARALKALLGRTFMRLIRAGDECQDLQTELFEIGKGHRWLYRCYWCNRYGCDGCCRERQEVMRR